MSLSMMIVAPLLLAPASEVTATKDAWEVCNIQSRQICLADVDVPRKCVAAIMALEEARKNAHTKEEEKNWIKKKEQSGQILRFAEQFSCSDYETCISAPNSCKEIQTAKSKCFIVLKKASEFPLSGKLELSATAAQKLKELDSNNRCQLEQDEKERDEKEQDEKEQLEQERIEQEQERLEQERLEQERKRRWGKIFVGGGAFGAVAAITGMVMMNRSSLTYQDIPARRMQPWVKPTYWTGVGFLAIGAAACSVFVPLGSVRLARNPKPAIPQVDAWLDPAGGSFALQWRFR